MNNIRMIYKYNIETGYENIATLTSDDSTNLLLIPELLEENKKKVEEYYKKMEFRKIITSSSDGTYSYRIYTFINGTLNEVIEYDKQNYASFPPLHSAELDIKETTIIIGKVPGYSDIFEYSRAVEKYELYKSSALLGVGPLNEWPPLEEPIFNPKGGQNIYDTIPIKPYDEKEEFSKQYEVVEPLEFHEGISKSRRVFDFGKVYYGFIDRRGNTVVPYKYDDVTPFCEGAARVEKDLKFGFVNTNGEEIVPCIYAAAKDFHDGLAVVKRGGKYGYVDKFGNEVIPCQYDYAGDFHYGLARVANKCGENEAHVGCVDKKGNVVIPVLHNNLKIEVPSILDTEKYVLNQIAIMQKYIEEHTNKNFDMSNYNQFVDRMNNPHGKIECFGLTYPHLFRVISIERQLKITDDDNETVYLDEEEAKQFKKLLAIR